MESVDYGTLEIVPYSCHLFLFVSKTCSASVEEFTSEIAEMPIENQTALSQAKGVAHCSYLGLGDCFLWLKPPVLFEVLSHELNHVVFEVFRQRGIEISEDSEEAFTYLQQYLIRESKEFLKDNNIKLK